MTAYADTQLAMKIKELWNSRLRMEDDEGEFLLGMHHHLDNGWGFSTKQAEKINLMHAKYCS